jgi:hypothetical protein
MAATTEALPINTCKGALLLNASSLNKRKGE